MSRARTLRAALWLLAASLFAWTLSRVPLADAFSAIRGLDTTAIVVLVSLNALALLVFGLKWWIVLRGLGQKIGLFETSLYRLAGFGFAYFTPGPRVGGEPVQVILAERRSGVPRDAAIASVALDRMLDASMNLGFLLAAALYLLEGGGALFISILLAVPLGYMLALARGHRPLAELVGREIVRSSKDQAGCFCRERTGHLMLAVLAGLASLSMMLAEYWLMSFYLGTPLSFRQLVIGLAAARIAYFLFLPAALGVLEAGQVMAVRSLGLPVALGVSLSLVIRFRDVLVAAFGLWWGMRAVTTRTSLERSS